METREVVRIVNLAQVSKYVINGVQPLNIEYTDRLVFVFDKEDTKELFTKWVNHTL